MKSSIIEKLKIIDWIDEVKYQVAYDLKEYKKYLASVSKIDHSQRKRKENKDSGFIVKDCQ